MVKVIFVLAMALAAVSAQGKLLLFCSVKFSRSKSRNKKKIEPMNVIKTKNYINIFIVK